jgi:biopolymer transport protein ExbD
VQVMSRQPDPLVISVARSGRMMLNNRAVSMETLLAELKSAKDAYADQSVLIRGDGEGNYQAVVDVMNACHQAQIRKFSLAFQPLEVGSPQSP